MLFGILATMNLKGVQPAARHCLLLNCLARTAVSMTFHPVRARVPQAGLGDA